MTSTTWLNEYLTRWPGVQQVFRLERRRRVGGKATVEVVYGISSLSPVAAPADVLLRYTRAHWGIEARHHVRDVTLCADRCRVCHGTEPRVLASLRNVSMYLLRRLRYRRRGRSGRRCTTRVRVRRATSARFNLISPVPTPTLLDGSGCSVAPVRTPEDGCRARTWKRSRRSRRDPGTVEDENAAEIDSRNALGQTKSANGVICSN